MLFADAAVNVIQIDWQSMAVFTSGLAGAILGGAKIIAAQWDKNCAAETKRHDENMATQAEARSENRALSQTIINIQAETVKTMVGMQGEIRRLADDSKAHKPV